MVEILNGLKVLAFDLETTGISTNSDRIVQIALIGADENGDSIHEDILVNPQRPIPSGASNVHGIYDSDVKGAPVFKHFTNRIADLINGAVIVGHNVRRFDMPLLENEYYRCGVNPPKPLAVIDTLEMVRRLKIPRPHNLGAQCARHGIDLSNAHDAAADAAASLLLMWKVMRDHPSSFRRSVEQVEQWLIHGDIKKDENQLGRSLQDLEPFDSHGRIRIEDGNYILSFGRNKGKTLKVVQSEDPGYLNWLLNGNGIEDVEAREKLKKIFSDI
ncbi:MAG: exonuclease domain-containing protein [Candidatus Poseidoniaceae archaeon]